MLVIVQADKNCYLRHCSLLLGKPSGYRTIPWLYQSNGLSSPSYGSTPAPPGRCHIAASSLVAASHGSTPARPDQCHIISARPDQITSLLRQFLRRKLTVRCQYQRANTAWFSGGVFSKKSCNRTLAFDNEVESQKKRRRVRTGVRACRLFLNPGCLSCLSFLVFFFLRGGLYASNS
jgi:hypothetical protein